ncbi:MAG: 3-dehydroquinate synthase [Anaerolineae bacterium]|nr:3-dehydroquinate synthase [Anaerolineae bacterium]
MREGDRYPPDNLVITGFMGTGKSVVGREVARRLGRPYVDMDAVLEERAGKPIVRIFAEEGEPAFRRMESELCAELCRQRGLVIATGGGTLVDQTNRALMMESGTVICLNATPDEILRRVGHSSRRPLLNVPDPRAEIERLLEIRRQAYASIPWQIDTTGLPLEEVVRRVLGLAQTITLTVHYPGGTYPVYIGTGLLEHIGGVVRSTGAAESSRVAVVSNTTVAPLYGAPVEESLRMAGLRPFSCILPDGEQYKTLATVTRLYDMFLDGELGRADTVLALGGGVIGDIAGFAAATFMRGVRFVQLPTTLLAMVDASVGGKTGVDLPQGKNLVGAFKQPEAVLMDTAVLATLPVAELRSGMAEVIKHGLIAAPHLLAELEAGGRAIGPSHIAEALRVKIAIVEADPFEQGRRAVLNLGHTLGHGLERLSGYTMRHGEAVSIGMVAVARISRALGQADPTLPAYVEGLLARWELPVRCPPYEVDAICEAMAHDKKKRGKGLRWVLPRAVGEVDIVENVPMEVVRSVLLEMGAV